MTRRAGRALRVVALWLSVAFRAAPWATAVLCVLAAATSVLAPLLVLGTSRAVTAAAAGSSLLPGVTLAAVALLLTAVAGAISAPVGTYVGERVQTWVHADLVRVTAGTWSVAHHEHAALADRVSLLQDEVYQLGQIWRLLGIVGSVAGAVALIGLLTSIHPGMIVLLLAALVPTTLQAVSAFRRQGLWRTTERYRRLGDALVAVLTDHRQGVEVRSLGLGPALLEVGGRAMDAWTRPWVAMVRRYAGWSVVGWAGFVAAYALAIRWVLLDGAGEPATVGRVTLLLLVAAQVAITANTISGNVVLVADALQIFGRYDWLRRYAVDQARDVAARTSARPPARLRSGIRLEGVSFAYPESDPSVRGIDLELPAGTTVALVGGNGAGKSTLVKLLARLYDPTSGMITIDGTDLASIDPDAWRRRVSAGFQDFATLELVASESIGTGDLAAIDDHAVITEAAATGQAEPVIATLPGGLDTRLGTRFDGGAELSGGQWQRLALARAFMRSSGDHGADREPPLLMLLDEPTAALDPEAEQAVYERYGRTARELARSTGAVTVLVSHRFSTVRMADLIVVLDDGRVTELGSHAELLARDGRYAELFRLQADAYR